MYTLLALALLGCGPGEGSRSALGVSVEPAGGTNGWVVEWTTPEPATGAVYYGEGDELDRVATETDLDPEGLRHRVELAGLAGSTTWKLQGRGGDFVTDVVEVETTPVPSSLPWFSVSTPAPDWLEGFVALPLVTMEGVRLVVIDLDGRLTWWRESYADFSFGLEFAADTTVTWQDLNDQGGVDFVSESVLYGGRQAVGTDAGHHDFVSMPGGGYLSIGEEPRVVDGVTVVGDTLVLVPAGGGPSSVAWSAWDSWTYDPAAGVPTADGMSWPHLNSVEYDADTGKALIGLYGRDAIAQVDVAAGVLDWELGGPDSDYTVATEAAFVRPHSPRRHGDEIWLIDAGPTNGSARAVGLGIDGNEASLAWTVGGGVAGGASMLGNAEYVDEDLLLVAWGSGGSVAIVDRDGEVYWQADAEVGVGLGYAQYLPSLSGAIR